MTWKLFIKRLYGLMGILGCTILSISSAFGTTIFIIATSELNRPIDFLFLSFVFFILNMFALAGEGLFSKYYKDLMAWY